MSVDLLRNNDLALVVFSSDDPHAVAKLLTAKNLVFQRVLGTYKGKVEYSFVVLPEAAEEVARAGYLDEQESVLYLEKAHNVGWRTRPHWCRHAWLMYMSLAPEQYVGLFQATHAAAPNEDYTYADNTYYVIRDNVQHKNAKTWAETLRSIIFGRIQEHARKAVQAL